MPLDFNQKSDTAYTTFFADLIIPRPFPNLFTYRVPHELNDMVKTGCRVVVQFGKSANSILTALVAAVHENPPQAYEAKTILELLDEAPTVNRLQLEFFRWISAYYMCHIGEVMQAALPSGLKVSSEARIQVNPLYHTLEAHWKQALNDKEKLLLEEIEARDSLTYAEATDILQAKNVYKVITSLLKKEAILVFEEIKEKYKPKVLKKIRLSDKYARDMEALQHLVAQLEKKPLQLDYVLKYLGEIAVFQNAGFNERGVVKSSMINESASASALNTLIKNGVFEEFEVIISRMDETGPGNQSAEIILSEAQSRAQHEVLRLFETLDIVLLHGITGSGKTEVYIELIKTVLEQGQQVLFLLPEIALTTQIVGRLRKVFGAQLGIYHSKYSDNERVDTWKGVVNGNYKIVVGVRSSIFLPFDNLGLVIIDEEHETSYKQYDPAPRYNARDTALMLARLHHAKVLLGSATPSVESYYNTQTGKWGLVTLNKRFGEAKLPEILFADMKAEKDQKLMKQEFTSVLIAEMHHSLEKKEQIILFQNRRGYSPYVACEDCNHVPQCKSCDVSLTFHLYKNELSCHYCGHHERVPVACPACGSSKIKSIGYGTEKLEEEVQLLLPDAKVARMDLDTTRTKNGYQKIINAVENEEIDILVGTQMVTKGLDFDKVNLVGVFDIDRMIHFPDFRSNERVFQLLVQVSGRAGRKDKKGKVIIQTANPRQAIFEKVLNSDYQSLYESEITEREKFNYPPFSRLIKLVLKNEAKELVEKAAGELAQKLRKTLGHSRVLGPESPLIDRIRDLYLKEIFIKLEKDKIDIVKVKKLISEAIGEHVANKEFRGVAVIVDVDTM